MPRGAQLATLELREKPSQREDVFLAGGMVSDESTYAVAANTTQLLSVARSPHPISGCADGAATQLELAPLTPAARMPTATRMLGVAEATLAVGVSHMTQLATQPSTSWGSKSMYLPALARNEPQQGAHTLS